MSGGGYIKLYRSLLHSDIMTDPERLAVWVYILLRCQWQPGEAHRGAELIKLEPGSCLTSRRSLARDLNISESKAERCLTYLERSGRIRQKKGDMARIVVVNNWKSYQLIGEPLTGPLTGPQSGPQSEPPSALEAQGVKAHQGPQSEPLSGPLTGPQAGHIQKERKKEVKKKELFEGVEPPERKQASTAYRAVENFREELMRRRGE